MLINNDSPQDILVITHDHCADGFASAWVINKWAKEHKHVCEFAPGNYGTEHVSINGRHVIMADFSYPKEELIEMSKHAKSITILDHHKSAEEALYEIEKDLHCSAEIIFDMNKSGCKITWNFLFPTDDSPLILNNIEDRDLWKFKFEHTKAISAAVFAYEYTFEDYSFLMDNDNYQKILQQGIAIEKKHTKDVNELFNVLVKFETIIVDNKKYHIPTANVPYMYASELGHKMCECGQGTGELFAMTYFRDKDGIWNFSLRSTDECGIDVSKIAKWFGGGGHRNASGFKTKILPWNTNEH